MTDKPIVYLHTSRTLVDFIDVAGHPLWRSDTVYGGGNDVFVETLRVRRLIDADTVVVLVDVIGLSAIKGGKPGKRRADIYAGHPDLWPTWLAAIVAAVPVPAWADSTGTVEA